MGVISLLVAMSVCVIFYQSFYLPESLERPSVPLEILEPPMTLNITIVEGAFMQGNENYVPNRAVAVLGRDNLVVWTNEDSVGHTVTSDDHYRDPYSGRFDTPATLLPGETHEFLFTAPAVVEYHCIPHPWMQAVVSAEHERF